MNPQGDLAGQSNPKSSNNENEVIPHLPVESLDLLPVHQNHNAASSGSNISTSSSLAATPKNPPNVAPKHAMQQVQRMSGGTSNMVHLPTKRSSSDMGESSNMGAQAAQAKRHETESRVSHISNNNNENPSPPCHVMQQAHQFFSEAERSEPIQGRHRRHRSLFISDTPSIVNTTISTRTVRRINSISARTIHCVNTISARIIRRVITISERTIHCVNTINERTIHRTIMPPSPHIGAHAMAPLHGQGSTMFGQIGTYRPNKSFNESDGIFLGRTPSVNFHQRLVCNGRAIMFHPPSELVVPANLRHSLGSQRMNYSGAVSSSRTRNYHNQVQISRSGVPTFANYVARRRLPSQNPEEFHALLPPPGLSVETIIHHLEREPFVSAVDTEDPKEEKEKCPICQEEFEDGDEIGKLHSCVHKFHTHCIQQWLMCKNFCPVCKQIGLETNEAGLSVDVN